MTNTCDLGHDTIFILPLPNNVPLLILVRTPANKHQVVRQAAGVLQAEGHGPEAALECLEQAADLGLPVRVATPALDEGFAAQGAGVEAACADRGDLLAEFGG